MKPFRHKISSTSIVLAGLSVCGMAAADSDSTHFESRVLSVVQGQLSAPSLGHSMALLDRIMDECGFDESTTRTKLVAAIDSLDAERARESELWQRILKARPPGVPAKEAAKFLTLLLKGSKSVAAESRSRSLGRMVKKAASRAELSYDGQALLSHIIEKSRASDNSDSRQRRARVLVDPRPYYYVFQEDLPIEKQLESLKVGVLSQPNNSYYAFFGVRSPDALLKEWRAVHAAADRALIDSLLSSDYIEWAAGPVGPESQRAQHRLIVAYRLRPSKPDESAREEWELRFHWRIQLLDIETGSRVFNERSEFSVDAQPGTSPEQIAGLFAHRIRNIVEEQFGATQE